MWRKLVFLNFFLVLCLVPGNRANAQDQHLVGWWKFDEMSGNIASDSSGNELHGILADEPYTPEWVSGLKGGALEFEIGDMWTWAILMH